MSSREARPPGACAVLRRHPVITSTLIGFTLAGAVLGFYLLTDDWSAARRLAAGALAGAGIGLLMTGTKLIG
jgi:hypothetical protein